MKTHYSRSDACFDALQDIKRIQSIEELVQLSIKYGWSSNRKKVGATPEATLAVQLSHDSRFKNYAKGVWGLDNNQFPWFKTY